MGRDGLRAANEHPDCCDCQHCMGHPQTSWEREDVQTVAVPNTNPGSLNLTDRDDLER